mmetsp:Transcript_5740/g.13049  ORF Transcript_5740/g.13049 Transcript_5740/m.13049 type:complete len:214 (-) Transcript_5740:265-906(-)
MQQPPRTIGQEKSAAISAALAHEQLTRERGAETVEVHDLLPALSAKSFLQPDILFRDAAQPLPMRHRLQRRHLGSCRLRRLRLRCSILWQHCLRHRSLGVRCLGASGGPPLLPSLAPRLRRWRQLGHLLQGGDKEAAGVHEMRQQAAAIIPQCNADLSASSLRARREHRRQKLLLPFLHLALHLGIGLVALPLLIGVRHYPLLETLPGLQLLV